MEQFAFRGIRPYYSSSFFKRRIKNINFIVKRTAVDLAYKIQGQCSDQPMPIIILHGLLGSKRNWDSMSKTIAETLNTCAVVADARNHGESPHDGSHSYLDLASDVSQLMSTLHFKRATIIGHSMGGRTAMVVALTEPDKIERLVIVDISPISTASLENNFFPNLIDVMKSVNFKGINNLSEARTVAKNKILESGVLKSMEGMNFILMNLAMRSNKTVEWVCNLETLKQSFKTIASFPAEMKNKKFYGPTLFIGGEESNYIPPTDLDGIKNLFPQAELKYIPGVGHNVHVEDPKTFLKLVKEFLST